MKRLFLIFLLLMLSSTVAADVIILNNEERLYGEIIERTPEHAVIRNDSGETINIEWVEIKRIRGEGDRQIEQNIEEEIQGSISGEASEEIIQQIQDRVIARQNAMTFETFKKEQFNKGFVPFPYVAAYTTAWGTLLGAELYYIVNKSPEMEQDVAIGSTITGLSVGLLTGTIFEMFSLIQKEEVFTGNAFMASLTLDMFGIGMSINEKNEVLNASLALSGSLVGMIGGVLLSHYLELYAGTANVIECTTLYAGGFGAAIAYRIGLFDEEQDYKDGIWVIGGLTTVTSALLLSFLYDTEISMKYSQWMNFGALIGVSFAYFFSPIDPYDDLWMKNVILASGFTTLFGYVFVGVLLYFLDYDVYYEELLQFEYNGYSVEMEVSSPSVSLVPYGNNQEELMVHFPAIGFKF